MKPSSNNIAMNFIVSGYLSQKELDEKNGTAFSSTWEALNGNGEAREDLTFDLSKITIADLKTKLKDLKCYFGLMTIHFEDGHTALTLGALINDVLALVEMTQVGSVVLHYDGKEISSDETSGHILNTLLVLENAGTSGGEVDAPTKEQFEALVKVTPTDIQETNDGLALFHDGEEISGQANKVKVSSITIVRH